MALLGVGAATVAAQAPDEGAIHGVVQGAGWVSVAGGRVMLEPVDGAGVDPVRTAPIAADHSFLFQNLPPGAYTVALQLPGGAPTSAGPVTVLPGQTVELRAVWPPGGVRLVEAAVDAGGGEPVPDRDGDGLGSEDGLSTMQNTTLLDGAGLTQSFNATPVGSGSDPAPDPDGDADSAERSNGPANGLARGRHAGVAYVFAQSSVREFRVSGQGYSAQVGGAGSVATTVTRSGSDRFHGEAFFVLRSQLLAASSPLATATTYANGVVTSLEVKPHDLRENFGASAGGPVPRVGGVFFFEAFDRQLRGFPAISSPANPGFYNLTAIQASLLRTRGVSPAATNAALNYVSSLTGASPRRSDQTLNFFRVDWRAGHGFGFSVEDQEVRWDAPAGLIDAPVVARGRASIGNAAGSLDALVARVKWTNHPRSTVEARGSWVRDVQYETPQTPLAQEAAIGPGGLAPEVNISPDGLLFGTPATLSQQAYPEERRLEFALSATLVRGRHSIAAGAQVALVDDRVATLANAAGTFRYDSGTTGGYAGGLVDFVTDYTFNINAYPNGGCPAITAAAHLFCFRSYSQSFGEASVAFATQEWAGFVEDTWRPGPRLMVHAGVRYEYTLLPLPASPNAGLDAVFGGRGASSVFPDVRNDVGPRVAVSYAPFGAGHGVVRAGFGVFFGRVPGATIQSALSDTALAGSTTRIRIRPSAEAACPQAPAQGFGYPCSFPVAPVGVVGATTSAMVFDRRFRVPVVQQGSLSVERELPGRTRVSATYVLNLDRHLPSSTDLNIAPATAMGTFQLQGGTGAAGVRDGETFVTPVYTSRVSAGFGPVTDIVSNVNASYHGLSLALTARPRKALELRGEWTWSKAIDYGQNQSAAPRTDGQFDPFADGYDKGLSSQNAPWGLRVAANWITSLERGPGWVRAAGAGWTVTPIVMARAGEPYSLDLSGGTSLAGGHESLNGSGGALYLPTVGRNTLRMPGTATVNLRAERGFRMGGPLRGHASVDAFNLLNHRNISSVTQRAYLVGTPVAGVTPLVFQSAAAIVAEGLNTQAFGTPTSASTSVARERQIQVGFRVEF